MTNCPLCKSKVTYVGFSEIECSGRGCENFKGSAELDEKITREWVLEFFGRVYKLNKQYPWYPEEDDSGGIVSFPLLKIHGFTPQPIYIALGWAAYTVADFQRWVTMSYPEWVPAL